ncbi:MULTISPECIES: cytochrome c oxidase assembly protein [Rheinheimera]|uniref:cytochrome c oxidase assembly protein n=1 Tax=Rheinheimera TaxID=67575 RepID=UPI001E5F14EE|nr:MULTISPECIES: cytochrome c oxidase assembly protein [Rheinheimera]MDF3126946.1 cytochrome c oxidase assembly protein [Rheinheimera sp. 1928-s]
MALKHQPVVIKLCLLTAAMFGFGYALVPLYDVFCDLTGLNGKTSTMAATAEAAIPDKQREVLVEFIARPNNNMPWVFEPVVHKIRVHPGEIHRIDYLAHNITGRSMTAQAVPSVSPGQAALYFNKMECFCFTQQHLTAGQQLLMPLQFYVDPALPEQFSTITLSYTLYEVDAVAPVTAETATGDNNE